MKNKNLLLIIFSLSILLFSVSTIDAIKIEPCKTIYLSTTESFEECEFPESNLNINYSNDYLSVNSDVSSIDSLWVANNIEGTVSKIDTNLDKEVARYRTGPNSGGDNPSRTAIDTHGNVWVANRGGANTLIKIAGNLAECIDKNGDGTIQTSVDTDNSGLIEGSELLPWGDDECVLLSIENWPANAGLRGLAIDLNGYVWIGAYSFKKYYKLDPTDGTLITTVDVTGGPYGAAVDKNGFLFSSGRSGGKIDKIDTNTNTLVQSASFVKGTPYGIAIDSIGRIWMGQWCGSSNDAEIIEVNANDISQQVVHNWGPASSCGLTGMTVDSNGHVWGTSHNSGKVYEWIPDKNNFGAGSAGCIISGMGTNAHGISQDTNGYLWAMNRNGYVYKINPNTCELIKSIKISGAIYTYSDATGNILFQSIKGGSTIFNFTNSWAGATIKLKWTEENNPEENILVEYRNVEDSIWTKTSNAESFNITPAQHLVKITINRNSDDSSPVLRNFIVESFCMSAEDTEYTCESELIDSNCNGIPDSQEASCIINDGISLIDNHEECNNVTLHPSFISSWQCEGKSCPPSLVSNGVCLSCNNISNACSGYNNKETCEIDPCYKALLYDCTALNCDINQEYGCAWDNTLNQCNFYSQINGNSCSYFGEIIKECNGTNNKMIVNYTSNDIGCDSSTREVMCGQDTTILSFFSKTNFILAILIIVIFYIFFQHSFKKSNTCNNRRKTTFFEVNFHKNKKTH